MGVAYGSCTGSTEAIRDFGAMLTTGEHGQHQRDDLYHA